MQHVQLALLQAEGSLGDSGFNARQGRFDFYCLSDRSSKRLLIIAFVKAEVLKQVAGTVTRISASAIIKISCIN